MGNKFSRCVSNVLYISILSFSWSWSRSSIRKARLLRWLGWWAGWLEQNGKLWCGLALLGLGKRRLRFGVFLQLNFWASVFFWGYINCMNYPWLVQVQCILGQEIAQMKWKWERVQHLVHLDPLTQLHILSIIYSCFIKSIHGNFGSFPLPSPEASSIFERPENLGPKTGDTRCIVDLGSSPTATWIRSVIGHVYLEQRWWLARRRCWIHWSHDYITVWQHVGFLVFCFGDEDILDQFHKEEGIFVILQLSELV